MNLLDYQKSGNAFGTNVTEYPKFSVLKDKIPKIPGVTSLPYIGGYIFQPGIDYYESFFGSRYQIVTLNGFVFYNPTAGASPTQKKYILTEEFRKAFDPLRQSIGSVPFQYPGYNYTLLKNSGANIFSLGVGASEFGIAQHASEVVKYNKGYVYDLPFNYIKGSNIQKIRFSPALESPFEGQAVLSQQTQYGANVDARGEKYKVFNVKKEQYVYIYTSVSKKKGVGLDGYKKLLDRHRLNFLSLFFEIPHKSDGYVYSTRGLFITDEANMTGPGLNRITFDNPRSPFDYDRTIERENPDIGADQMKSFYKDGLLGQDPDQKSKEISSLAFQRFAEIERALYYDYSFDVESNISVAQYDYKPGGDGWNGGGAGFEPTIDESFIQISVPSGVPVNPKAMDGSLVADEGYLTADIASGYNYLNATWENAATDVPETAIPNIYTFASLSDSNIAKAIKNAFYDIGSKALNCLPYEDFVEIGKSKKLIFIGSENILNAKYGSEFYKDALPMHNTVEFDIYSNANREIYNILHEKGIYKDFLLSLLTLVYGPRVEYETKYDLSQKTEIVSEPEVTTAHKNVSKSLLAAEKYFISSHSIPQRRITSLKPSIELPQVYNQALVMKEEDPISFDFEKWYQYYLNHFEYEFNLEADPYSGKPLIDKSKYQEYFSDFTAGIETLKAPSETTDFQPVPVAASIGEMKSVIVDKMRDINDILSKKASYSEPIMYRIEKLDINNNVIQTIFIPHFAEEADIKQIMSGEATELTPKIKKLRYIDSQVKYGKVYRYKIIQYRIVIASEYRYVFATNDKTDQRALFLGYNKKYDADTIMKPARSIYDEGPMAYNADMIPESGFIPVTAGQFPFQFYSKAIEISQNQDVGELFGVSPEAPIPSMESFPKEDILFNKMAIFKTILYPSVRIEEVPYYEEEVIISDFPPIPPNVNFDPLIGKGSKLLITFENQTGDREEVPQIIENIDNALFSLQRTAQNRNAKNNDGTYTIPSLRFKSDDFPKTYQIFKLDTPPSSYADFVGNKYRDLDVEAATAIVENLEPNRTFYYMFRSVDIHDNVSNPSAVFAVQMTFNSGVYYPVVSTYEFQKEEVGTKFKQFQQYMKIEAALIQKFINKEKSNITDASSIVKEPVLGIGNQSLWNQKKFKFRIISKHTGKIMDLNVKFKTRHTQPVDPAKSC